jgi:hypothetical protein
MRVGFGRLVQTSGSKHIQLFHHVSPFRNARCRIHILDCRLTQYSCLSDHAFTTISQRLDEAENVFQQHGGSVQTTKAGAHSRSRKASKGKAGRSGPGRLSRVDLHDEKKKPDTWASKLNDIYLKAGASSTNQHSPGLQLPIDDKMHLELLDIITASESKLNADTDLLTYMGIKQGRWKAVLWTMDKLLQNLSTRMLNPRNDESPSNIIWDPEGLSLAKLTRSPFSVEAPSAPTSKPIEASTNFGLDPKYTVTAADTQDRILRTMKHIWKSLGCLIIEAADLPEEQSEVAMAVVYQIIAKVHALGLVPDNVYSYETSVYSSMVSRPPILHLLSSRVLTTLSDATWRSHQMEVIEQAVSLGTPLQSLVKDLPGGRFRLKVRPLGPEVWLEFVLWCCVEGGFGPTGHALVKQLQEKAQNPWFAMPWTSQTGNSLSNTVDWDRVHSRHGGSVGLIEGYNRERPFVEMAPRTVSAEVVLMLVESMVNSVNTGVSGRSLRIDSVVLQAIPRLIRFLEPHSLPTEYFDYIAVRMLQTGAFDIDQNPSLLERWAERMSKLQSLESTFGANEPSATFELPSIIQQSEVHIGMLHQAMEAYVERFDVRGAIQVFNRIQELVDVSKVQSISAFLATTSAHDRDSTSEENISLTTPTTNLDFVRSHGQLPLHKLAAFLNLTTDSKLFRIGQWLLSSDEVDEPVIPKRLYDQSALTTALVRYAGASGDEELVAAVIRARRHSSLLPSVTLFRSLVDALISTYNFREAHKILTRLKESKGGGYSPKNLASSVAAILTLTSHQSGPNTATDTRLNEAWRMTNKMMNGHYDGRTDPFRSDVLAVYRQQLAALLMVLSRIPQSQISSFGQRWKNSYPLNNLTTLATDTFNVLLAGVVATKGSSEGMKLCQIFCDEPSVESRTQEDVVMDDILAEQNILGDDIDYNWSQRLRSKLDRIARSGEYVPFVDSYPPGQMNEQAEGESQTALEQFEFMDAFPVEVDGIEDAEPETICLVKPDLRTLRIVVQGALAERRARKEGGLDTAPQTEVLQWAAQYYRLFGTSTAIIQQEIQLPIVDPMGDPEQQRTWNERKRRRQAAAVTADSHVGHAYKQFHSSRPVTGDYAGTHRLLLRQ